MNGRKTTVSEVLFGRRRFWAGMVFLMCFLSLFCSNAWSYATDAISPPNSGVYGIQQTDDDLWLVGVGFGHVTATADDDYAYGILNDSSDGYIPITIIIGSFDGLISGKTLGVSTSGDYAGGLYSDGSIWFAENMNGTITATAYGSQAYALGSY